MWRPKSAYLCTKYATTSVFGDLVWVCYNGQCQKMSMCGVALQTRIPLHQRCHQKCVFGVAPQTCIPLHQVYHQQHFWIPSKGVFEIQNVKKCVYGVAPLTCIPLHQTCHQKCFWIPSVGLFEMDNAKKCALLEWHPKRAYLCTKYTTTSVFGYLVWVCLQCTMPKKSAFWGWRPKHAYLCTTYKINRVRYLCNYYFVNHK